MPQSLHLRTLELLKESKLSLMDVHKESGLPYYWLRKLVYGAVPDPSVNRIQALYEFLTNSRLELK